ncbi:hypothetical protein BDZ89DRAFT_935118, partial [Hymenopellis radicata]
GSFGYDSEHEYSLQWDSEGHFLSWLQKEQSRLCVEYTRRDIVLGSASNSASNWLTRHCYTCARAGRQGGQSYVKLNPGWKEKANKKPLAGGCSSSIVIKTYPGTNTVLGKYQAEHSHPVEAANIRYTGISKATREDIREKVEL